MVSDIIPVIGPADTIERRKIKKEILQAEQDEPLFSRTWFSRRQLFLDR